MSCLVLVAPLVPGNPGYAADVYWNAGTADWFTDTNWAGGTVPTNADWVIIDNNGQPQVLGPGAQAEGAWIGSYGRGTVSIGNGGTLTVDDHLVVGVNSGGRGTLNIFAGGTVVSASGTVGAGAGDGSVGSVGVNGGGSGWVVSERITVGDNNSSGVLIVAGGGSVTSGDRIQLGNAFGDGGLVIGSGGAAGIVNTERVHGGGGTASVSYNHTDADYHFTRDGTAGGAAVLVTGSVELGHFGTGTTTLSGENTYTGGTLVGDGTLRLEGAGTLGSEDGALRVNFGTLDINGTSQTVGSLAGVGGGAAITLGGGSLTVDQDTNTTFSGAISGAGDFTKTGEGTLTLTGANAHTGATRVSGGTLFIGGELSGDERLGAVTAVTVDEGATLAFGQTSQQAGSIAGRGTIEAAYIPTTDVYGGTLTIGANDQSAHFSGALLVGTVNKTGTGSQTVSGTHALQTLGIYGGTLRIGDGGWTGVNDAAPNVVMMGGGLDLDGNDFVIGTISDLFVPGFVDLGLGGTLTVTDGATTFNGEIAGSGAVVKQGSSTFTLAGSNSFTGLLDIENGTLRLGASGGLADTLGVAVAAGAGFDVNGQTDTIGSLSGAGTLALGNGTLTLGGTDASSGFSGTITGEGNLIKTGSGTLTLGGDSSGFAGATSIADGTLIVDDALGGNLFVLDGGGVGGAGAAGDVVIGHAGALGPGSAAGTLAVGGDFTFAAGSRYEVEVDPGGTASDLIAVTGTATIDGGAVVHIGLAGDYQPGSSYTILTAAGGVAGSFEGVSSDFAFLDPILGYGTDAVTLTLQRNDIGFGDIGHTRNQFATAAGIESLTFGHGVFDAVVGLDEVTARSGLDQLSGEIHASMKSGLIEESRLIRDAVSDRLASAPAGEGGSSLWGQALGAWSTIADDGNAAALEQTAGGFVIGADGWADQWRLGILAAYGRSGFTVGERGSSASSDNYHLGLYGGTRLGSWTVRAGAAYGRHDIGTDRTVAFSGFSDRLKSDYGAGSGQVFGEIGYDFDLGGVRLQPFAGLSYVRLDTEGFAERGGAGALEVNAGSTDMAFATVGLRASAQFMLGAATAQAHGMIGWQQALGDKTQFSQHAFSGGSAFTIAGAPVAQDAAILEAGLDLDLSPEASFGLSYRGQFGTDAHHHTGKLDLSIQF